MDITMYEFQCLYLTYFRNLFILHNYLLEFINFKNVITYFAPDYLLSPCIC